MHSLLRVDCQAECKDLVAERELGVSMLLYFWLVTDIWHNEFISSRLWYLRTGRFHHFRWLPRREDSPYGSRPRCSRTLDHWIYLLKNIWKSFRSENSNRSNKIVYLEHRWIRQDWGDRGEQASSIHHFYSQIRDYKCASPNIKRILR